MAMLFWNRIIKIHYSWNTSLVKQAAIRDLKVVTMGKKNNQMKINEYYVQKITKVLQSSSPILSGWLSRQGKILKCPQIPQESDQTA